MEDLLNKLQNEPIILVLVAVLAVAIAFLFMIPVFINYLKSFGLTKTKADDEVRDVEEPEEEKEPEKTKKEEKVVASETKKPAKKLPKFSFNLNLKKNSPKTIILAVIALIVVVGVSYYAYDFFFRPVRIVNAWQVRIERYFPLNKLQEGGLGSWQEAKIYLLDLRSRKTFANEHLTKSVCLPANEARDYFYPIDGIPLVVYSDQYNLEATKEAADAIAERGRSGKIVYKKIGQIIVVKDGYEGLKGVGLKTETGEMEDGCD